MSDRSVSPMPNSVITSPTDSKLSFFGKFKQKLKGKNEKERTEATHAKLHNAKEDDRIFEEAQRNFLDMEASLHKLNDHMEKHLHAMQEAMLYQQMISNDFTFFYASKGSYFAKSSEEYKQKCTENLKLLSSTVFPSLAQLTLQPIRTQLAALPEIKELLSVRTKQKSELEAYRSKVGTLRKAAGLPATGTIEPSALAALPSNVSSKLGKKVSKLTALTTAYERMNGALLESLVKYVNSKDLILNQSTLAYLDMMQEYHSKNLILHTTDIKLFMKNLQATASQVKLGANAAAESGLGGHRKSNSVQFSGTRHPYASFSSSTMPRQPQAQGGGALLPLHPDEMDDIEEAEQNPLARSGNNRKTSSNPVLPSAHALKQSQQYEEEEEHDPSSLLSGFGKLRAEALARDQRKLARRASGLINLAVEQQQANAGGKAVAGALPVPTIGTTQRHSLIEALSGEKLALGVVAPAGNVRRASLAGGKHRPTYSVFLYNNPPFLPTRESNFMDLHKKFDPSSGQAPAIPAAIETTSAALKGLCQPRLSMGGSTIVSALPLKDLVDAAPKIGSGSSRLTSLDTKSHLLSPAAKGAIPIVNTEAFLQQHRAEQQQNGGSGSQPGSRRTSNAAPPTAVASQPVSRSVAHNTLSPPLSSLTGSHSPSASPSGALGPAASSASPMSSSVSLLSSHSGDGHGSDDDDDEHETSINHHEDDPDYIPPPPEPIDWDQITDSSSEEEDEDEEVDDDDDDPDGESHDTFVTPRAADHSRATSSAFGFGIKLTTPNNTPSTVLPIVDSSAPSPAALPMIDSTLSSPKSSSLELPSPSGAPRASISVDGSRGKPILTGKFAALTAKFGECNGRSNSVSVPALTGLDATTLAPAATGSKPAAKSMDATPLPTFESSPPLSAQPTPASTSAAATSLVLDDGATSAELGATLQKDLEAVFRLASAANKNTTAPTAGPPLSSPTPSASTPVTSTAAASTDKPIFRSPFMRQPDPASTQSKSPFTMGGQVARSPFLQGSMNATSGMALSVTSAPPGPPTSSNPASSLSSILHTLSSPTTTAAPVAPIVTPPVISLPPPEIVVALYDYVAQREVEISFKKGDLLTVVSKDGSGWWTGFVKGENRSGVFPSNYCQTRT